MGERDLLACVRTSRLNSGAPIEGEGGGQWGRTFPLYATLRPYIYCTPFISQWEWDATLRPYIYYGPVRFSMGAGSESLLDHFRSFA